MLLIGIVLAAVVLAVVFIMVKNHISMKQPLPSIVNEVVADAEAEAKDVAGKMK